MSNYNHFDYVPSTVDRKRSIFKYKAAHARAGLLGYLYPICKPIRMMPGSSITLDLAADIRSGALIAPLMDEIYCDVFGFFVPNRIVWEHWKQFIGALDDVTFNNRVEYQIPTFKFGAYHWDKTSLKSMSFTWNQCIACHFGLPYPLTGVTVPASAEYANTDVAYAPEISALPFRGYTFIWNEYFRPLQILSPLVFNKTDTGYAGQNMDVKQDDFDGFFLIDPRDGVSGRANTGGAVLPVSRAHRDLWTASLPAPSLETLNLLAGLQAPVGIMAVTSDANSNNNLVPGDFVSDDPLFVQTRAGASGNTKGMIADFNQALLTVNNYRETIMLQNYWDVLNRAGSRYDSIIRNIFGVTASSQLVDIPDLIIHKRFTIYRKEVVATATGNDGVNAQPIGTQASYINTVVKDSLLTTSTVEHGYLHLMWAIRPARLRHSSGIEPDWFEKDKFDLYYPQFDGMGDVARYKSELFYTFSDTEANNRSGILGYQEYGATWKFQRSDAAGYLDPHTPSYIGGYTLCDNYDAQPALNGYFIGCLQEMLAFANCLAISDFMLVPQFVIDFRLNGTITHPMPVYNIPGAGALL